MNVELAKVFLENFKAAMEFDGINEPELARRLGVTPQAVWKALHQQKMTFPKAEEYCEAIGHSAFDMMQRDYGKKLSRSKKKVAIRR